EDGRTGLHFNPGDSQDLADKAEWAWARPDRMSVFGREARLDYESKYTPERNYQMLMAVYKHAISSASETGDPTAGIPAAIYVQPPMHSSPMRLRSLPES